MSPHHHQLHQLLHLGHGPPGREGSRGGGQPGLGDEWGDGQHEGHSQHEEREQMHFSMFEGFNLSDSNAFCFSFNLIKVRMTLLSFFGFIALCCKYGLITKKEESQSTFIKG